MLYFYSKYSHIMRVFFLLHFFYIHERRFRCSSIVTPNISNITRIKSGRLILQILNPVGILISSMQMLVYSNFTAGVNIKRFKLRVKQTAQKLVQWIKVVMSGRFSCLYLLLLRLLKKNIWWDSRNKQHCVIS